ncbi:MAG TPA: diaminopimelate decarboxylase [Allosphingosinicella sp.]|jgi:diaminopimelate decarboxylase
MSSATIKINDVSDNPLFRDPERVLPLVREFHSPLYIFDESVIRRNCRELKAAMIYRPSNIRYACKALTIGPILAIIREEGLWIDASSINEVERARRAGFAVSEIYYTGEGATLDVYRKLVSDGILVNCTSHDQLRLLAAAGGRECSIRINPGKGSGSSRKITTGGPSSKHGIYIDQLEEAKRLAAEAGIRIVGVHSHIGSGTDLQAWLDIADVTIDVARTMPDLRTVNLGGGLPVVYEAGKPPMPVEEWGRALAPKMERLSKELGRPIELQIEPGRYVVAACGLLVAEVQAVKSTPADGSSDGYNFVIVNTGLNHNIRPSLYGAFHPIKFVPPQPRPEGPARDYVVAGYLCESGDVFTVGEDGVLMPRRFPEIAVGDVMVMAGTGAYSHAMKNEYNSMNLPMSLLIDMEGEPRVIERRGTIDDIMRREVEAQNKR